MKQKSKNADLYFIFDLFPKYQDINKLKIRIKLLSNIVKDLPCVVINMIHKHGKK